MTENTQVHRQCLACGFPFWEQLTAEEQDMLCRYTRPVKYQKGARVHSPTESCVGILLLRAFPAFWRGGVHPFRLLRHGCGKL